MYSILSMALNYHVPTNNCTKYGLRQYTFPSLGTYEKSDEDEYYPSCA
jgi:hypothetical protein